MDLAHVAILKSNRARECPVLVLVDGATEESSSQDIQIALGLVAPLWFC
jgi:hypothetical protein